MASIFLLVGGQESYFLECGNSLPLFRIVLRRSDGKKRILAWPKVGQHLSNTAVEDFEQNGPKSIVRCVFWSFSTSTCVTCFSVGCVGKSETTERKHSLHSFGITNTLFGLVVRIGDLWSLVSSVGRLARSQRRRRSRFSPSPVPSPLAPG
jgi:hypothetical protein